MRRRWWTGSPRPSATRDRRCALKIYLIAPKNPESFWTFDRALPSLGKRCVFPNLSLPTVAGLTPPGHDVVLCDENVEPVDFETDADVVGLTGYVVHKRRILELAEAFRRRGKLVVAGGPFATLCPEELRDRARALAEEIAAKDPQVIRLAKQSLNGIDPVDVKRSYRYEQGFTFELTLGGAGDKARQAFVDGRPQ